MAQYAFDNKLMNTNGWKWAKKDKKFTKLFLKFLARIKATKTTTMGGKVKVWHSRYL